MPTPQRQSFMEYFRNDRPGAATLLAIAFSIYVETLGIFQYTLSVGNKKSKTLIKKNYYTKNNYDNNNSNQNIYEHSHNNRPAVTELWIPFVSSFLALFNPRQVMQENDTANLRFLADRIINELPISNIQLYTMYNNCFP